MLKHVFRTSALCLAMLLGLGCVASCSDNETGSDNPSQEELLDEAKNSAQGQRMLSILSLTADVSELPDNWQDASFKLESVTIGKSLDPAAPFVRTMSAESDKDARRYYTALTGRELNENATADSWSMEGIGTIAYRQGEEGSQNLGSIEFQVPALPLSRLDFIPVSLFPDNGSDVAWEPYYRPGDIVYNSKEQSYWICARPARYPDKEKTHWFSFQLVEKNHFKTYTKGKKYAETVTLPKDLGEGDAYLDQFMQMLYLLANPEKAAKLFQKGAYLEDGLSGLGTEYTYEDVEAIARDWDSKGIWNNKSIMPVDKSFFTSENSRYISVIYKGHELNSFFEPKGFNVFCRRYNLETACASTEKGNINWLPTKPYKFDARVYTTMAGQGNQNTVGPELALIVRYKSGKEINNNTFSQPAPEKPFDQKSISTTYHYVRNSSGTGGGGTTPSTDPLGRHFYPGDIIRDKSTSALWLCLSGSGDTQTKSTQATFISLDSRAMFFGSDNRTLTNAVAEKYAARVPFLVSYLLDNESKFSTTVATLRNSGKTNLAEIVLQRDSTVSGTKKACRVGALVYAPTSSSQTNIIRFILDKTASQTKLQLFKKYLAADKANMQWADVTDKAKVTKYAKDAWSVLNFTGNAGTDPYRTDAENTSVTLKSYLWDINSETLANAHVKSMFNEPVLVCTFKLITDSGTLPTGYELVKKNSDSYWNNNNRAEPLNEYFKMKGHITLDGTSYTPADMK